MLSPRHITFRLRFILLSSCVAMILIGGASGSAVFAQQSTAVEPTAERGILLYEHGDLKGAIKALRAVVKKNPDDVVAWNHLALALEKKGEKKETSKAFGQVADLRFKLFQKEFKALKEKTDEASIARLKSMNKETLDSIKSYLAADALKNETRDWYAVSNLLLNQSIFLELAAEALAQGQVLRWSDVPKVKLNVLKKPEPGYTEEARSHGTHGTVVLKAMLASDGTVKEIKVIRGLRRGLTERAVEAARRIEFQPATVGARPVSQYVQIEYNFNVY